MATIRKRVLPSGSVAWQVDYKDGSGKRRARQFTTRRDADAFLVKARAEVAAGVHTPDSTSVTVAEAGALWLQRSELDGLEASTLRQYRQHLDHHIAPLLGGTKLSRLTKPSVEAFKDKLLETRSKPLTRAILTSLKGVIKEAQRRGLLSHNPASDTQVKLAARHDSEVMIPSRDHIRLILEHAPAKWRPLLVTAIFTGLRCSELRGLTWDHVDLTAGVIRVRQRADFRNVMGSPKSRAGRRDVPMSPMVLNTLKAWKLACPITSANLVFPSARGTILATPNIHKNCWGPLQKANGMVDAKGKPLYTFHALRHAAASLFIEQGWTPKKVQTVMGHSSITVTFDIYGHLWPSLDDDREALGQMEARLLRGV